MKTLQALDTERPADDMDLILREAHHRMKNTLLLFGSVASHREADTQTIDVG